MKYIFGNTLAIRPDGTPKSIIINKKLAEASFFMSHLSGSNRRPIVYKTIALPTELRWQTKPRIKIQYIVTNKCYINNIVYSY